MNGSQRLKPHNRQPIRGKSSPVIDDLIARFIDCARNTPKKIAIITSKRSLTYQQLYLEAFAWKQILEPYRQGRLIICLERDPALLVLLLAMQWIDITYIPIDPSIPIERLRNIIADSEPQGLLYNSDHHPQFNTLNCTLLDLKKISVTLPPENSILETYTPKQTGTAYIIYTSGSTGKPKGVAIPRRGLHNLLMHMSSDFLQREHELALATTTISFDIAVAELYLPIWQHKTIFLANQTEHKDPLGLGDILRRHPITFIGTTPSFWSMLLGLEWTSHPDLVVICVGEPITPLLVQRSLEKVAAFWNGYGPTEATVYCSFKRILLDTPITVGRPITNMEMCVMDQQQRMLPPYVKGELYIGGIGLAEEYVNNPELTQQKFISYPNALLGRLYQVGDLACVTNEGEFIIFGRTDNQIKLHGYRVELEEIDAQIQAFPGVREGIAAVHEEQLIAYLAWSSSLPFSKSDFIQYLHQHLPQYMIPVHVVLLEQLPKTVSGKIDRKAVPPPQQTPQQQSETLSATPTQLSLIRIWSEEFKREHLSIQEDFFALGGHSLSAARITVKIAQQLGKKLNVFALYQAPTIEKLAVLVEAAPATLPQTTKIPSHSRTLPLQEFQFLSWVSNLVETADKNLNVVGRKRFQGAIDKASLDLALQFVLQKQDVFVYHIHHYYPLQSVCRQSSRAKQRWEEKTLTHLSDSEIETYLHQTYDALFYNKTWKVKTLWFQANLYYLQHQQIELQICMHHLIADEQSIAIFFQELFDAYAMFQQQIPLPQEPSLHSYRHYILEQHHILQQHAERDLNFWTTYLEDANLLSIAQCYHTHAEKPLVSHIPLSESFIKKLNQICAQYHLGLNELLSAAISLTLLPYCDNTKDKFWIGVVKSNRNDTRYDRVIGCFLRMDVIKLDLNHQPNLVSLAQQAQQAAEETATYQNAASFIKTSAIGKAPITAKPLITGLIDLMLTSFSVCFPKWKIHRSLINACKNLATWDMKKQLLINLNVLPDFIAAPNQSQPATLLGCRPQMVPLQPPPSLLDDYIFDVFFHRSNDQHQPFMVVTAALSPEFHKNFGETLIAMIENHAE